jgi:hypothetical protein
MLAQCYICSTDFFSKINFLTQFERNFSALHDAKICSLLQALISELQTKNQLPKTRLSPIPENLLGIYLHFLSVSYKWLIFLGKQFFALPEKLCKMNLGMFNIVGNIVNHCEKPNLFQLDLLDANKKLQSLQQQQPPQQNGAKPDEVQRKQLEQQIKQLEERHKQIETQAKSVENERKALEDQR